MSQYQPRPINDTTVFLYKDDPAQVGSGRYKLTACFLTLGVCVPFIIESHSEKECLKAIGTPFPIDPEADFERIGCLSDFSLQEHHSGYPKDEIIKVARAFTGR